MKIFVVLVRPEYSSNVGAAARALANMGGDRLILIDPQCTIDEKAKQAAAGAQTHLQNLIQYPDWPSFYSREGEGVRIAFSRRGGKKRKVLALDSTLERISRESAKNIYLIFGPEADGLNADDLAFVNFCCHLPVFGEFGSMNLAQAVLLGLFITRQRFPPSKKARQITGESAEAVDAFYFPDALIRQWLVAMGFDVQARRSSAYLTLRRLFLQNLPTRHEIQVLESVLQQNIRKLMENRLLFATKEVADDLGDVSRQ